MKVMIKAVLVVFILLSIEFHATGQVYVSGHGYYTNNWDNAKDRMMRQPIGGVEGGYFIELYEMNLGQRSTNPLTVIKTGGSFLKGSEFIFKSLKDNAQYYIKICANDPGSGEIFCYDFEFFIPKGTEKYDLGKFVYLFEAKRWVPLNVILNN
jgi:hypothetical protein